MSVYGQGHLSQGPDEPGLVQGCYIWQDWDEERRGQIVLSERAGMSKPVFLQELGHHVTVHNHRVLMAARETLTLILWHVGGAPGKPIPRTSSIQGLYNRTGLREYSFTSTERDME